MKFSEVAIAFNEVDAVTSRLKITELLADLLDKASPQEAAQIAYLSLGELYPPYIGTKFNFAEKSMYKVLGTLLDKSPTTIQHEVKKWGDVGLILEKNEWKPQVTKEWTVLGIVKELNDFIKISGTGSQEVKEKAMTDLLSTLDALSGKFVIRIIMGKLRLGFSDMTLLDAFSWMEKGDKSLRSVLEDAYNICADIGHIAKVLKEKGEKALEHMVIVPGIPIRPAGAERMSDAKAIIEKLGHCVVQPKLDGFRLQVHKWQEGGKVQVRFFSRNLLDMTGMFPDLMHAVSEISHSSFVVEGEAIAYDPQTGTFLPFQETVKRKRKYEIEKMAEELPLQLYLFDILYKGTSMLDDSHEERRKHLIELIPPKKEKKLEIIKVIEEQWVTTAKELQDYFSQNVSSGLEGVVVKKPNSIYQAGKRNFNWIKLKREESGDLQDSIDCVVLGYYAGYGKRAHFGIGALLVGVYNKKHDRFETIAKIGSGLTDEGWKEAKKKCEAIKVAHQPKNVVCAKELAPDTWVNPEIVCEILADEITLSPLHKAGATADKLGYALRFPRILGYRPDKSAENATEVHEVDELYHLQFEKEKRGKRDST